jgi:hypothetical protein
MDIKLPQIVIVDDYHEFSSQGTLAFVLKDLNPRLRVTEAGVIESKYLGVVYEGRKPSRDKVLELLRARFGKTVGGMYIEVYGKEVTYWRSFGAS